VDMGGIKGSGIILCCVGVVLVGIVDEMCTVGMGEIIRGEVVIGGITRGLVMRQKMNI